MSKPKDPLIGRLLDIYKVRRFREGDFLNVTPIPVIATWILATEYGMRLDGTRQILRGRHLIERENVFTTSFRDGDCIAEHLYYGGWTDEHGGSYKDALPDIAARWAKAYQAPRERRLRSISTPDMLWNYYFLKNAETAFPAIGESPVRDEIARLKRRPLGGSLVPRARTLEVVAPANPLGFISKWHRMTPKPRPLAPVSEPAPEAKPIDAATLAVIRRNNHKISVVVPIYNVEAYLVRCLKSIQSQTHADFEALLIDDGSTDGGSEIARAMADADGRFRYYRKSNGGLGDARNYAIPLLDSDLVTFVDSDDFLREDHLRNLEAKFRQGHDFAICNMTLTTPDGRITETRNLCNYWGEADPITHALLSSYECYAWNKMYLTETFTKNPNARYSLGWFEDFALTPALVASARNLAFVPEATYNYVQRPNSILATARTKIERNIEIFDSFRMLQKHRDHVPADRWKHYMDWMAPKHYFRWRVISLLGERSYGRRVAAASAFAQKLNAEIPDWSSTPYIESFVREPGEPLLRLKREALVQAFKDDDLAFFAQANQLSDFAL